MADQDLQSPVHGGGLLRAAHEFGIAPEQWLDLSTGINPQGWAVPNLSPECWQSLPQEEDGLIEAARLYYGSAHLLAVAGSQAAIQALPRLRRAGRIGVLAPAYAEHAHAWRREGHEVISLASETIEAQLPQLDVLLLINPNNPTGERFTCGQLQRWHEQLTTRGGWLLLDEAFIDASPEQSIATLCGVEGLVVLRSLGKFFGLAGARVGFVLAWPALLRQLKALLGPWSVSGPSREIARLALQDRDWQQATRLRLHDESERLATLLASAGLAPTGGTALFQYCPCDDPQRLYKVLAGQGVLVRLFDVPAALRFGLPGTQAEWQRLETALASLMIQPVVERRSCR